MATNTMIPIFCADIRYPWQQNRLLPRNVLYFRTAMIGVYLATMNTEM